MPTVPMYNQPQTQTQGLRSPQFSGAPPVDAFGGGKLAEASLESQKGLEKLGLDLAQEEKKKADQMVGLESDKNLSDLETELTFGKDGKGGIVNTKGKDSLALPDEIQKTWKTKTDELKSQLTNEDQKMAFDRFAYARWDSINKTMNRQISGEMKSYNDSLTESYLSNERNLAIANYFDPERIAQSIERQQAALQDYGRQNGWSPELLQEKTVDAVAKTHIGVISRMLDNNRDLDAQKYYQDNKESFGPDVGKVEKALEEGSVLGESQRQADSIISVNPAFSDAMKATREIKDPKVRDKTEERVKNYFTTQDVINRQEREKTYGFADQLLEQSAGQAEIPLSLRAKLNLEENKNLDERKKQLLAGVEPPANGPEYFKYKLMFSDPDTRMEASNTDLRQLAPKMTKSELHELLDIQTKVREKDGATSALLDYLDANEKIKRDTMDKAGLYPHWYNTADEKGFLQFNAAIDRAVSDKEAGLKRKLQPDEMQEIADRFATEAVTRRKFLMFNNSKLIGNVQPEDLTLEDIPVDTQTKIKQAMEQQGWPASQITEQRLKEYYIKGLRQGVIKPNAK